MQHKHPTSSSPEKTAVTGLEYPVSVAPMIDWTDRHYRMLLRIIHPAVVLYTEMVVDVAIIHGNREYIMGFSDCERPLVLQLGGSEPRQLAQAAQIAYQHGYRGFNLNVGCPSDRVQQGRFGACLMAEPERVRDCIAAITDATGISCSIKTRLGIDHQDSEDFIRRFIDVTLKSECSHYIIHARKAWLQGLSPKQNRTIPPLQYDVVWALKKQYPDVQFSINGGIDSVNSICEHLQHMDGVMLGRAILDNPMLLAEIATRLDKASPVARKAVVRRYFHYCEAMLVVGVPLRPLLKPLLNMFHGQPYGKRWRQLLSDTFLIQQHTLSPFVQQLEAMPDAD